MLKALIKAVYDKPIANFVLDGGKTEIILQKVRNETRVPILPTPIQHSPGISTQSNKARRGN
jgi:hypothetical protein